MTSRPVVAARILATEPACLGHEIAAALRSGADRLHVDVMELSEVDVTVGPRACRVLKRLGRAPVDVHLLVRPVEPRVAAFAAAGVDVIAFHPEATDDPRRTAALVRAHGCRVGLALAPGTPLQVLDGLLELIDLVLVTWPAPGEHGERLGPWTLRFIRALRARFDAARREVGISVDGGIDEGNAIALLEAGVDTFVVQSALCRSTDRAATIVALKGGAPARRLVS